MPLCMLVKDLLVECPLHWDRKKERMPSLPKVAYSPFGSWHINKCLAVQWDECCKKNT